MRVPAIICAAFIAGCGEAPRPVVVAPPIPPDLLQPVEAPCPPFVTEGDVARCLIRKHEGLRRANGQIEAIRAVVGVQ